MRTATPKGNWALTIPLAGLGLGYLFLFFLPSQRGLDRLHQDLSRKQDAIAQADGLFPAIAVSEQQLAESRRFNSQWVAAAPSESELPGLLGKVNAMAKTAGITTTRLDPQPAVQYEKIRRMGLTAAYRGTFAQICRFLCELESLPESVWIDRIQLDGGGETGKDMACELTLAVFVDKTDESDQAKRSG